MDSEDRLHSAQVEGARAGILLNDETFINAKNSVREELIRVWTVTKSPEEREKCWQAVNLLDRLAATLSATHANGKIAAKEVHNLVAMQERKKRFGIL